MNLKKIEERIKKKTTTDSVTQCWLFTGYLSSYGYGRITVNWVNYYVHTVSAIVYLNFDPYTGLQVNHKCSNKNCWNPEHLYVGTQMENVHDSMIKGNSGRPVQTHCKNGHEFTEENTYVREKTGDRLCRTCRDERNRRNYESSKVL